MLLVLLRVLLRQPVDVAPQDDVLLAQVRVYEAHLHSRGNMTGHDQGRESAVAGSQRGGATV